MSIMRKLAPLAGAVTALCIGTVAASAAPAYSTTSLNVRSGPGTGYRVVDTLRPGEPVNIEYCRGSWCFVNKAGPDGWASATYLSRGPVADRYDHYDRYDRYDRYERDYPRYNRYRGPRLPFTGYRYSDPSVCFGSNNARLCFE
ncbi:SH3 domain-containing protein, partial [Devosia sp.]|uniref:SH3 domain-containing protein n=1 Tax=Devosia sp. TaxID=1871048 RepID=UPI003A8F7A84